MPKMVDVKDLMITHVNLQDTDDNNFLHYQLRGENNFVMMVKFLKLGGKVHLRNSEGRTPLHDAVRYSPLGIPVIQLLLAHDAQVNSIDNKGSSILHDALKSPYVTVDVIEVLLKANANPNIRDHKNIPPLGFVEQSCLLADDKKAVEKLLIMYSLIKAYDDFDYNESDGEIDGDELFCLHFCKDKDKRKEYSSIRHSCFQEILKMEKEVIKDDISLLSLIYIHFSGADDFVRSCTKSCDYLAKKASSQLDQNKYPIFEKMLRQVLKSFLIE